MDLKHKNTSRWAKMALQHGRGDKDLRLAYHESVQLGNDLLRKSKEVSSVGGQDDSEDEGDFSSKGSISRQSKEAIGLLSGDSNADASDNALTGKYKKLFDSKKRTKMLL